jgi:hypothetical protein
LPSACAGKLMVGGSDQQFAPCSLLFRLLSREPPYGRRRQCIGSQACAQSPDRRPDVSVRVQPGARAKIRRLGRHLHGHLRGSVLYAPTFDKKLPRLRDYQRPNFSTRHLLKDVRLVLHEAAALGLSTKVLDGMPLLLEEAIRRGLGELDYSALLEVGSPSEPDSPRL